jgi:hypothetical protein
MLVPEQAGLGKIFIFFSFVLWVKSGRDANCTAKSLILLHPLLLASISPAFRTSQSSPLPRICVPMRGSGAQLYTLERQHNHNQILPICTR